MMSFEYTDQRYRFSLSFPELWRRYGVISRRKCDPSSEYEFHVLFKYGGKVYTDVLNIVVYRMTLKQWNKQGYDDSPLTLLAESNGRIFAYSTPGELPSEFLNKSKDDYDYKKYGRPIRLLKRMVNIDVPQITKTFRLQRSEAVQTSPYLAASVSCSRCRLTKRRKAR